MINPHNKTTMHLSYLALLIFFAPSLHAMALNDAQCLSILTRILLNHPTDFNQEKKVKFCGSDYSISSIENTCGAFTVCLKASTGCRTITLNGAGMHLKQGGIALHVKEISVSQ